MNGVTDGYRATKENPIDDHGRKSNTASPPFSVANNVSLLPSGYKGISIAIWETKDALECPPAPADCAFPTGQSVLDYLQFDGGNRELWLNFIYLVRTCSEGFVCVPIILYNDVKTGQKNQEPSAVVSPVFGYSAMLSNVHAGKTGFGHRANFIVFFAVYSSLPRLANFFRVLFCVQIHGERLWCRILYIFG